MFLVGGGYSLDAASRKEVKEADPDSVGDVQARGCTQRLGYSFFRADLIRLVLELGNQAYRDDAQVKHPEHVQPDVAKFRSTIYP